MTETAANAILLAVGVNTLAKTVYAGFAGGGRLGGLLLVLNLPRRGSGGGGALPASLGCKS